MGREQLFLTGNEHPIKNKGVAVVNHALKNKSDKKIKGKRGVLTVLEEGRMVRGRVLNYLPLAKYNHEPTPTNSIPSGITIGFVNIPNTVRNTSPPAINGGTLSGIDYKDRLRPYSLNSILGMVIPHFFLFEP